MAQEKREKLPQFVTPAGTFKFPRLGEPDTKFDNDGRYSVKLILSADAAKELIAKLEPLHTAAVEAGQKAFSELKAETKKKFAAKKITEAVINPLFTEVLDDNEQPTGEIELSFGMKASGEIKKGPKQGQRWSRKPGVFDAKMKPMDGKKVWGGTVGKVSFEAQGYFIPGTAAAGLGLKLLAVQVLDLVSAGERSASHYGFGEEEGYEASDEPAPESNKSETGESKNAGEGEAGGDDSVDF